LGGTRSAQRTPEQTEAVKFWSQPNLGLAWHQAARQLAKARRLELAECARLFALLSIAHANTFIVDWDAKFHYNFWRPLTAIRNGDIDGNDSTERDAGWLPLNATPMQSGIPIAGGHPSRSDFGAVLCGPREQFGERCHHYRQHRPELARQFATVAALAEEQRMVRIWGGIHFRSSLDASDGMGRAVVPHRVNTVFRPVR